MDILDAQRVEKDYIWRTSKVSVLDALEFSWIFQGFNALSFMFDSTHFFLLLYARIRRMRLGFINLSTIVHDRYLCAIFMIFIKCNTYARESVSPVWFMFFGEHIKKCARSWCGGGLERKIMQKLSFHRRPTIKTSENTFLCDVDVKKACKLKTLHFSALFDR